MEVDEIVFAYMHFWASQEHKEYTENLCIYY